VTIRSGWSKALARPVNDGHPDASLRLERGSSDFVRACTHSLFELGASTVWSSPVPSRGRKLWERAGFVDGRELILMERSLARIPPQPPETMRTGSIDDIVDIDRRAFERDWQIGQLGLEDALSATVRSRIIVAEDRPRAGFAIAGVTATAGYLQRLAVDPDHGGQGLGRHLLRAAMSWSRVTGARSMLLNTQPENERATLLYRSEGFVVLPERLSVLMTTFRRTSDQDLSNSAPDE
jgi:ribosomal protein S18 acetylase RimI-like enzyme